MEKIQVTGKHKRKLATEFGCSMQAVRMSLEGYFNSERAKNIRKRAKEMLIAEANRIII